MAAGLAMAISVPTALAQNTVSDPAFFSSKLYPVFETAQCRMCHTPSGVASGTRLHFPEKNAADDRIYVFGLSLSALIDRANPSNSLLLNKPTNRKQHTGGVRIKPGSGDEKLLIQWIEYLASTSEEKLAAERRRLGGASAGSSPDQLVRRLTHSQYNNTIRDLLGDYSRPAQRFPPEDFVDGFKNQLRHQGLPPVLVESYSTAAERLALNAFRVGDINGLIPCKPASASDSACRASFVRSFGLRAFRRPLREAELQRYAAAFTAQAGASGNFLAGAQAVVEAMLQSPKFLFHVETGADGSSRDFAIASRLSYFLWDTMPDQALFDSAARGELSTTDGRERAARRMLEDPRANQALDEFFSQWLRFDRVLNTSKERRRYPEFTPELAAAMVEETRRLLQHLVSSNRNFMELFTADYGFLNSDLATLYKLPAPPGQFELVTFPPSSTRAGLLGQGSFLASTAGPAETSPTSRGIFVREQLLCQHVPPPPPNVDTNLAEPDEKKPLTRRNRLAAHVENPSCAACHRLMDPIGFGLEHFDAIGKWRDQEAIYIGGGDGVRAPSKKFELPLETKGEIAGLPDSSFSESRQIGRILAASPVCQECVVRQTFRYAYGRLETASDQESIRQIFTEFRDSGFKFKNLLTALVRSPEFLRGLDNK
jgi:hypothetical protein